MLEVVFMLFMKVAAELAVAVPPNALPMMLEFMLVFPVD